MTFFNFCHDDGNRLTLYDMSTPHKVVVCLTVFMCLSSYDAPHIHIVYSRSQALSRVAQRKRAGPITQRSIVSVTQTPLRQTEMGLGPLHRNISETKWRPNNCILGISAGFFMFVKERKYHFNPKYIVQTNKSCNSEKYHAKRPPIQAIAMVSG